MMQRRELLGALALCPWAMAAAQGSADAPTAPPEVAEALPAAQLQGAGQLRFLGLQIYDIRLWVSGQRLQTAWADVPLALEVIYRRRLNGRQIAERSLTEMRRQGEIDAELAQRWLQRLTELIPDVAAGDRLTAVNLPGSGLRLLANGNPRGEVQDKVLAQRFLGIWLAPETSEPQLRLALLGRTST